jgi:hypothetical protein
MDVSNRSIVGVYGYVEDNTMGDPKEPIAYKGMNSNQYDLWVNAYKLEFQPALNELKSKIKHISYARFQEALADTVGQFQQVATKSQDFRCVSLVQPGKSQKWVTEVAMTKGFKADAYVCLGEEGANNLDYSLEFYSSEDKALFRNVVIIDDGSFSGNQMANNISSAHRLLTKKFDEKSTFHILIPFITQTAYEKISQLSKKGVSVKLYAAEQMPVVNALVDKKRLPKLLEALWPHLGGEERLERGNTTSGYWFDHKMPNSMSFPDVLARGLVTQPKNKDEDKPVAFLPDVQPPYK